MKKVCILDYGCGNVKSVRNAFDRLSIDSKVSNEVSDLRNSSHIVLPGVGAFGNAMKQIQNSIPLLELKEEVIAKGKPFLGICVGMQVLAEWGNEYGKHRGLSWFPGTEVRESSRQMRQPHIGWNNVTLTKNSPIFEGLESDTDFYFVHSYILCDIQAEYVIATTAYGLDFASAVQRENVFGVQFHPEKSQKAGLKLIKNFTSVE